MDTKRIFKEKRKNGQGLVELAIMLPILLILLFGLIEMGFGLRNYLIVVNAAREGGRFAARGRYTDRDSATQTIASSGVIRVNNADVSFLRPQGNDPNVGVIVREFLMDDVGEIIESTSYVTGVISAGGGVLPISIDDSLIDPAHILDVHSDITQDINDIREANMYARSENRIVTVEVFYMHHPLGSFIPLPDPWNMYARSVNRIVTGRNTSVGGGGP